jgi:hypothetical protein
VTEEEREASFVELADAFERAADAGLRLRTSDTGGRSFEASCPVCAGTLMVSGSPWDPVAAARRLDAFMLLHHDHTERARAERDPAKNDPAERDPAKQDHTERDPAKQDHTVRDPAKPEPAERDGPEDT